MLLNIKTLKGKAYLSFPQMKDFLVSELQNRFNINAPSVQYGDLLYYEDERDVLPCFAQTVLCNPNIISFDSNSEAAIELKSIQRNWSPYQFQFFRKANFIQEKLPYINLKPRTFPTKIPRTPIGVYTLISEHSMIASSKTTSVFPAGQINFVEDHVNPPSRAYLKLWESLTLAQLFFNAKLPCKDDLCFEAGASPGGWTWVLTNLNAKVIAVDRAELSPPLMKNPLVHFISHDAFTLKPQEIGKCDWVFSDVICYPERLLEWVNCWLSSGLVKNMICTIKMQGKIDWSLVSKFESIPNSRVVHLNYNKHELTFIHCENKR